MQYFSPFTSMDIAKMAHVFGCSLELMEKELVTLISSGLIHGRVDSTRHVGYRVFYCEKATAFPSLILIL